MGKLLLMIGVFFILAGLICIIISVILTIVLNLFFRL